MYAYSMSRVGGCPRAILAERLAYEPMPASEAMERAAKEGSRHEAHIAEDLEARGWAVTVAESCKPCGREGQHVEMEVGGIKLVGHVDRVAANDVGARVAEFKALGRWRAARLWKALDTDNWEFFPEYAAQLTCYMAATGLPALYAVKNRDTGELRTWEIDRPPLEFEDVVEWLRLVEEEAAKKEPELFACGSHLTDFAENTCPFRYLHDERPPPDFAQIDLSIQIKDYLEIKRQVEELDNRMEEIKGGLLEVARERGTFFHGGCQIIYSPAREDTFYRKADVEKELSKEALEKIKSVRKVKDHVRIEEKR